MDGYQGKYNEAYRKGYIIQIFDKTLKSVLSGRKQAASGVADKNEVNTFLHRR